jgi:nitrile hydratase subunit beta
MNGVHDLGGMHGLGRVSVEGDEPVFHNPWEKVVFGTMLATMGQGMYNLDEFRHGIEVMGPAHYLTSSYYEHWLETIEKNLIEKGIIDRDELDARTQEFLKDPDSPVPQREEPELADNLSQLVRAGASTRREVSAKPQFEVGDRVRTRNVHPRGIAVVVGVLFLVLPAGPDPGEFPAGLLRDFRLSSLGTQLVLWAGIGVIFGLLCERANRREPVAS